MSEIETISIVITAVVSVLATFFTTWGVFKRKLHTVREFVDTLDDALQDDKVTEQEYRELWEKFKAIFNK
jgi:cell shape-determining protein MreC